MNRGAPAREGKWCVRCYRADTQPAGEGCKNPGWHVPIEEAAEEEQGAERVRLPYAED